jgi:succinate dehydrogenase / fumarate reductase cytochrome b subunit
MGQLDSRRMPSKMSTSWALFFWSRRRDVVWLKRSFASSVVTKLLIVATGLGLGVLLIAQISGNLLIYVDGGASLSAYAHGLHAVPGYTLMEIGLLVFFVAHMGLTFRLSLANKTGQRGEAVARQTGPGRGILRLLASKTMAVTGLIVLTFLAIQLGDFRLAQPQGGLGQLVLDLLSDPLHASLYAVCSILVCWHVSHGIQAAFRAMGFMAKDITPAALRMGSGFAIALGIGFTSIPVWIAFLR